MNDIKYETFAVQLLAEHALVIDHYETGDNCKSISYDVKNNAVYITKKSGETIRWPLSLCQIEIKIITEP